MSFLYHRTVHFGDTDAAGVVFFANYLVICHEAYEESLAAAGIELLSFFSKTRIIIPVAKSEAVYLRPLHVGDKLLITAVPTPMDKDSYRIDFEIARVGPPQKLAARVRSEHVCLDAETRHRRALPDALAAWVESQGLKAPTLGEKLGQ
jgi:1,4-dihydroxy-2-naphthoyl-CoA hydrolase